MIFSTLSCHSPFATMKILHFLIVTDFIPNSQRGKNYYPLSETEHLNDENNPERSQYSNIHTFLMKIFKYLFEQVKSLQQDLLFGIIQQPY